MLRNLLLSEREEKRRKGSQGPKREGNTSLALRLVSSLPASWHTPDDTRSSGRVSDD